MEPEHSEMMYVLGGWERLDGRLESTECYDASSGQWKVAAAMSSARCDFGACVMDGDIYVTGGSGVELGHACRLSSVEKYTSSSDTWSAVAPLPKERYLHAAVSVGLAMYVLGGRVYDLSTTSVLKLTARRAPGAK